jgi:TPR repeat protein
LRGSIARAAWERLNYPLFIPPDAFDLVAVLAKQGREQFITDLISRADSGTAWAATTLGLLELKGEIDGRVHLDRAEQLCLPAAHEGNPYAQYVLAYILVEQRRPEDGFRWMNRAATSGNYPPALADLGRFVLGGVGIRHPDVARGIALLWSAHRRGHKAALLFICGAYRSGRCGPVRRLAAYFMLPYALWRHYWSMRRNPFAQDVFVNYQSSRKPLFR